MGSTRPSGLTTFRHDPYNREVGYCVLARTAILPPPKMQIMHTFLRGKLDFVPFPQMTAGPAPILSNEDPLLGLDGAAAATFSQRSNSVRLFLGQLPFQQELAQLHWILKIVCGDVSIHDCEKIMKKVPKLQKRLPTGCVHAWADSESDLDALVRATDRRILIERHGFWYAESEAQMDLLEEYCLSMKRDISKRFREWPYQTMVLQRATSACSLVAAPILDTSSTSPGMDALRATPLPAAMMKPIDTSAAAAASSADELENEKTSLVPRVHIRSGSNRSTPRGSTPRFRYV